MNVKDKILQIIQGLNADYVSAKQLRGILQTHSTAEKQIVQSVLEELVADNYLLWDERNHRYRILREEDFGKAVFQANQRGFGFLLMEDGNDLFVPASKTCGAFNGDTVLYRRVEGTADEAQIVRVISRGVTQLVGTYDKTNGARFVLPDDKRFIRDVFILPKSDMGAKHGQKVVVDICFYPKDNRNNPEGKIVQVLGYPDDKDVDMLSVAHSYRLSQTFPDACQNRANKLPQTVTERDLVGRKDLRSQRIFTIDGADAKDLDDAVSIVDNGNGTYLLGVHIADVSHYVKPGDDIDKEAFARGTSVYLPQMVFPMLPRELSNGVCSLYQGVDRLTLTCQMTIDGNGKVVDYDLFPSVINSKHRLTYDQVQQILDGDKQMQQRYADITADLLAMERLARILQNKRDKRGNIQFAGKEVTFVYDDNGGVVDVVPFVTSFSHQLIEEFMIVANETVAEYAQACSYPFVYRVHDKPDEEKLSVLLTLMRGVGINVKRTQQVHNSTLQNALEQAKNTPYFNLINDVMLRTMQKAKYSETNTEHFGLASRCYCHFTSPIRRYPDLTVHRVLKTALAGKFTDKAYFAYEDIVEQAAFQSNVREKVADEAERKAQSVKKCAYAQTILGQSFTAIVSGVTERGIFAELPNTVEGFISIEQLPHGLKYNAQQFCLANDHVRYALGDQIAITVASVNKQACKIDFDLAKDVD